MILLSSSFEPNCFKGGGGVVGGILKLKMNLVHLSCVLTEKINGFPTSVLLVVPSGGIYTCSLSASCDKTNTSADIVCT